jgi:hypothetical protein
VTSEQCIHLFLGKKMNRFCYSHEQASSLALCLLYQPPANGIFLLQQTSHQQPASSIFILEQIIINHQPPTKRTCCKSFQSRFFKANPHMILSSLILPLLPKIFFLFVTVTLNHLLLP